MATITEAEGFSELGMFQAAWDTLEEISPDLRATPEALRVRLACCPALNAWDLAVGIAHLLKEGREPDRQAAARFYHALAMRWLAEGDRYAAGQAIKAAVKAWPDHRLKLLEDPEFSNAGVF